MAGRGQVGEVTDGGGYRNSIDEPRPNYYWTLAVPSSGLAFALSLSEGRSWRWANKVAEAIAGRRTEDPGDRRQAGARGSGGYRYDS